MPNINALSLILQKIWARLKFLWQTDRHTGQTDEWDLMFPAFAKGGGQKFVTGDFKPHEYVVLCHSREISVYYIWLQCILSMTPYLGLKIFRMTWTGLPLMYQTRLLWPCQFALAPPLVNGRWLNRKHCTLWLQNIGRFINTIYCNTRLYIIHFFIVMWHEGLFMGKPKSRTCLLLKSAEDVFTRWF